MKRILRIFAIETFALYLVSGITRGIIFERGNQDIFLVGAALALASLLARPVINLLLLPLNLVTFGFFRWVSNAITLFLIDLVLPQLTINSFYFSGFSSAFFSIPPLSFPAGLFSYIAFSLPISFITSFIYWLID